MKEPRSRYFWLVCVVANLASMFLLMIAEAPVFIWAVPVFGLIVSTDRFLRYA